jgi:hypothetical protein
MAKRGNRGKLYHLFTFLGAFLACPGTHPARMWRMAMVGLASAMFVALFGWGGQYFGWVDPDGKVQLALFTAFVLGAVAGYKSRS